MKALDTNFVQNLARLCCERPARVALPELTDPRVLTAAAFLLEEKSVAMVHSLASADQVMAAAKACNIDLKPFAGKIRWADDDKKHITAGEKPLTQVGELLRANHVDAVVAGATCPTADVIRTAIGSVGLSAGCRTVSGAFFMNRGEQTLLFADCGVVIEPTLNQLIDIATSSVQTWRKIMGNDIKPVVAFLSFSTHGSAHSDRAEKVAKAYAAFKERFPHIECDGEMQFDAAFDVEVGKKKCPGSKVPGRANCFIFPNLESGNIAYKMTQRLANFFAYGPILQGAAKPFSDLSRGATAEDVIVSVYINSLRAWQD